MIQYRWDTEIILLLKPSLNAIFIPKSGYHVSRQDNKLSATFCIEDGIHDLQQKQPCYIRHVYGILQFLYNWWMNASAMSRILN